MTPPPPPRGRRKLVLLLGCASVTFVVVLVGVAVLMFAMLRREREQHVPLPRSWRDDLRAYATHPPEAARLRLPRTDSGAAATLLFGRRAGASRGATVMRLARGMPLDSLDRERLAQAAGDTTIDVAHRAARRQAWGVVGLMLADTTQVGRFWNVTVPEIYTRSGVTHAVNGLILRGYVRARSGRFDAAREDFRAAISLGLMMHEREPSMAGANAALGLVRSAARLLAESAERRDTALAGAARRLAAWTDERIPTFSNLWRPLYENPDSARAAIADTTLPFPFRAEALYLGTIGEVFRDAWRMFRGPSGDAYRTVRAFQSSPDTELAALALAADSGLARIDRIGGIRRIRGLTRQR